MFGAETTVVDLRRWLMLLSRAMSEQQRLEIGPRMFDLECEEFKSRLRKDRPECDESEILTLLRDHINSIRESEAAGELLDILPGHSITLRERASS